MRTAIIYKSIHHNNTLKIVQVMADELGADIFNPENANDRIIQQYDLIGFGSGIYFGKHHRSLLEITNNLDSLSGKDVFLFHTSGFERFPIIHSFGAALTSQLERKGAHIKDSFSCRGWETWGPFRINGGKNKDHPDEVDFDNARIFARSLIQ